MLDMLVKGDWRAGGELDWVTCRITLRQYRYGSALYGV